MSAAVAISLPALPKPPNATDCHVNDTCPKIPPRPQIPAITKPSGDVTIAAGNSSVHHYSRTVTVAAASSATAAIFLAIITLAVLRRRRQRRRISRQTTISNTPPEFLNSVNVAGDDDSMDHHVWYIRTAGLDESIISSITTLSYKSGDGLIDDGDAECAVCLVVFRDGDVLRLLPKCRHAFHLSCIDVWLRSHVNCPLCRAPILSIKIAAEDEDNNADDGVGVDVDQHNFVSYISGLEIELDGDENSMRSNSNSSNSIDENRMSSDNGNRNGLVRVR